MKLEGERKIPASVDQTWAALNDPETLKACITGCETLEQSAEDEYLATMKVKIGPVNAKFKGKLKLSEIVPPQSYKIHFEGQGGAAGFGKGSADVALSADGAATILRYTADAQVGGKIAQIGSRLVDAAAAKIAEEFFSAFEARLSPATGAETQADAMPSASAAESAPAKPAKDSRTGWLLIAATALAALAYWFATRGG